MGPSGWVVGGDFVTWHTQMFGPFLSVFLNRDVVVFKVCGRNVNQRFPHQPTSNTGLELATKLTNLLFN